MQRNLGKKVNSAKITQLIYNNFFLHAYIFMFACIHSGTHVCNSTYSKNFLLAHVFLTKSVFTV